MEIMKFPYNVTTPKKNSSIQLKTQGETPMGKKKAAFTKVALMISNYFEHCCTVSVHSRSDCTHCIQIEYTLG